MEELPTNVLSNIQDLSFQIALRGFFIMLAISLHAVFEGMAMGLGTKASFVWYLCFAVAVHKFIIAFCIGLQVQLRAKQAAHLVNKHYQNEVTLTGQNPILKCW